MRIIMVDWSGRKARPEQAIALAEVRDGRLIRVEKGRNREQVLSELLAIIADGAPAFIGLDFAFSLPAWFLQERGWSVENLWAVDTEEWLSTCESPFWGRPGVKKPEGDDDFHLRYTDQQVTVGGIRPKSVFQVGGAGSVGSGSLRGFWILPRLREAGATIWPFESASKVTVAEVYPRAFTGPVVKGVAASRAEHLAVCSSVSRSEALEQAMIQDEDCFDAGCTAMALWPWRESLVELKSSGSERIQLEGAILTPKTFQDVG